MAIKTAIIGLGIMGRRMLEHMCLHEGYSPAFLWDPNPKTAGLRQLPRRAARSWRALKARSGLPTWSTLPARRCPARRTRWRRLRPARRCFWKSRWALMWMKARTLCNGLADSGVPTAVNFTQAAGAALTQISAAATSGALGDVVGADIVVTYANWPRDWQKAADWLRFREEGGMTREVVSHFLFFSERILGPLSLVWARPSFPADKLLCETHMLARLEAADGRPVTVMASVGGAQPDRQELTIKGSKVSRRVTDFYRDAASDGGEFAPVDVDPADPRATSLKAQLDDLLLLVNGKPNRLATPEEALRVQKLVEGMLIGRE